MERRHYYTVYAGIVGSILIIILSVTLALSRVSTTGRAQTPGSLVSISAENSYVFASPIQALGDGATPIRLTVFLLNNQGLGVEGQIVSLDTPASLTITDVQRATDRFGRAIFDVTSGTPGSYTIRASTSQISLPQSVSISFE